MAESSEHSTCQTVSNPLSLAKKALGSSIIICDKAQHLSSISDGKQPNTELLRDEILDFIENGSISLHWVTSSGIIKWANREELNFLGYTDHSDEYIGKSITDFHADKSVISDILRRLTNFEILRNYPARLIHKNGSIKHVLIDSSVYCDEHQNFVHTRCFSRDVTSLKLAESEQLRYIAEQNEITAKETAEKLMHLNELLSLERQINLRLLHSMLPSKVAADLLAGNSRCDFNPGLSQLNQDFNPR